MARILIVDDEDMVCEDLKTFLTAKEHEVEVAYNGEEGLTKLKAFRPHLVLLDIRMPGVSGLEALPRMKTADPNVRIIMLTAVHDADVARMAVREGADDYITKPVDLDHLQTCIMINYIQAVG